MGNRKKVSAEKIKEAKNNVVSARLNNCRISPRKMRLIADQVRGHRIDKAISILKFSPKEASISNWQSKNESKDIEKAELIIKEIRVDSAGMLKRLRTAPQGRAHRIRKRSNHVTIVLGSKQLELK